MIQYKYFSVTGVANETVEDAGLTSTIEETYVLKKLILNVSGHAGNFVEGSLERKQLVSLIDHNLDTGEASGTNNFRSVSKISVINVDVTIPVGQTFKAAIKCGGTNKNLYGAYVYEVA